MKDVSLGSGKDVSLLEKVQITGMHQAEETEKSVETDKIKLRIVHCLLGNIVYIITQKQKSSRLCLMVKVRAIPQGQPEKNLRHWD